MLQFAMQFTLNMAGGDVYEIRTEAVLYVTPVLAMSVDDFYAQKVGAPMPVQLNGCISVVCSPSLSLLTSFWREQCLQPLGLCIKHAAVEQRHFDRHAGCSFLVQPPYKVCTIVVKL